MIWTPTTCGSNTGRRYVPHGACHDGRSARAIRGYDCLARRWRELATEIVRTIDGLKVNMTNAVQQIQTDLCDKVIGNWTSRTRTTKQSRGGHLNDVMFHTYGHKIFFQINKQKSSRYLTHSLFCLHLKIERSYWIKHPIQFIISESTRHDRTTDVRNITFDRDKRMRISIVCVDRSRTSVTK